MASTVLTKDDFKKVYKAVYKARVKWRPLGIELDIELSDLDDIKDRYYTDGSDRCLEEVIRKWLKRHPTLEKLITALKEPIVGEEDIALDIEERLEQGSFVVGKGTEDADLEEKASEEDHEEAVEREHLDEEKEEEGVDFSRGDNEVDEENNEQRVSEGAEEEEYQQKKRKSFERSGEEYGWSRDGGRKRRLQALGEEEEEESQEESQALKQPRIEA